MRERGRLKYQKEDGIRKEEDLFQGAQKLCRRSQKANECIISLTPYFISVCVRNHTEIHVNWTYMIHVTLF